MAGESMEQTETQAAEAAVGATAEPVTDTLDEQIMARADNPDAVRKALQAERETAKRARKEADALAAKVKEYEDRDKTEQERLADERDALRNELDPLKLENLRLRVAFEKKLPLDLVDRLQGDDRETLEADADKLLALVATTTGSRGTADQGAREGKAAKQLSRSDLTSMSPEAIVNARLEGRLDGLLAGGAR